MLKRRRKLSKDLQIRKKITTFAEDKRHLGKTIKRACCVALDLHYLCIRKAASRHNCSSKLGKFCSRFAFSLHRVKKNGSAHRDSDTRVRQIFCGGQQA